jgi:two-component system response regulator FixJ
LEVQQDLARRGIRIPTIIITACDEAGIHKRCRSAGAIAYLAKPMPEAALFAAIEAAGSDRTRSLSFPAQNSVFSSRGSNSAVQSKVRRG